MVLGLAGSHTGSSAQERGRLLPAGWCPGREQYLPWALLLAWALPVCCGQACNDAQSWGCLGLSQGQGSPVLVASMSQSRWLSSAVGLPGGCESCVGIKQQVKEGNTGRSFWVTGLGAGSWDSSLSRALGTLSQMSQAVTLPNSYLGLSECLECGVLPCCQDWVAGLWEELGLMVRCSLPAGVQRPHGCLCSHSQG